ncbi:hypothetical protein A5780_19335 [Nocardia sp. 852002-20019_SCH5090214]|nr:hypothetical protein A5780_19335 [Nocardia sp. 852002-20019_SCH5090214]
MRLEVDRAVRAAISEFFDGDRVDRRPQYLDTRSAMAYSGLSRTTLYELLRAERIAARKIGAKVLYSRESLDLYLRQLPAWGTADAA